MSLKHDSPFTLDTLYKTMCKGVTWSLTDRAGRHGVPVCPLQVPVVPLLAVQSPGGGGGLHSICLSAVYCGKLRGVKRSSQPGLLLWSVIN